MRHLRHSCSRQDFSYLLRIVKPEVIYPRIQKFYYATSILKLPRSSNLKFYWDNGRLTKARDGIEN